MSGRMSCVRMSIAKTTAMRKNTSDVPMYIAPIFLWSVVVSQAPRPPRRSAASAATGTTADGASGPLGHERRRSAPRSAHSTTSAHLSSSR